MADVITMKFDLTAVLRKVAPALHQRVVLGAVRGMNRTGDSERTAMARAVADDMGVKVGEARDAIRVEKATVTRQVTRVIAKGARLPLFAFNARGPVPSRGAGRGVSYRIGKASGRTRAPHAFIATMGSGHTGVFERIDGGKRRGPAPHRSQLPIRELFGPSIAHVFGKLIPVGEARRQEVLLKNVQHEIQFALTQTAGA